MLFVAFLLLASTIPAAEAQELPDRCQAFSGSCTFVCEAGEIIGVSGISTNATAAASGSCGGASTSCSGSLDCLSVAVALTSGTGTCTKTSGQYADCFALTPEASLSACTITADYGACSFECTEGTRVYANATSRVGGGFPRVRATCGAMQIVCQASMSCSTNAVPAASAPGICLSRTASTTAACISMTLAERCQATTSTACSFRCAAGDIIAVSGIALSGTAAATGGCGGATVTCSSALDCLAVGSASASGIGSCTRTTGQYAECFSLPPSAASSCSVAVSYAGCVYRCTAGEIVIASANSSSGFPRVRTTCGAVQLVCQSSLSCSAGARPSASATGVCLGRTVSTNASCASVAARCQAVDASCSFACLAGDAVVGSGIAQGGLAGATGQCGSATSSCSGQLDCVGPVRTAFFAAVGTCARTDGQYADCFSLPAPTSRTCALGDAYGACVFVCTGQDVLDVGARSTMSGGFPRVLSRCGDASTGCQDPNGCEVLAQTSTAGRGVCLSRTASTQISCVSIAVPASAPARCDATSGHCFVSCEAGDAVGASAFENGGFGLRALVICGGVTSDCVGYIDCLKASSSPAARDGVGVCKVARSGMVADCFSAAPVVEDALACATADAYGVCAFACEATDVAIGAVSAGFLRVLASCGGAEFGCRAAFACTSTAVPSSRGIGLCLSRTHDAAVSCASTPTRLNV